MRHSRVHAGNSNIATTPAKRRHSNHTVHIHIMIMSDLQWTTRIPSARVLLLIPRPSTHLRVPIYARGQLFRCLVRLAALISGELLESHFHQVRTRWPIDVYPAPPSGDQWDHWQDIGFREETRWTCVPGDLHRAHQLQQSNIIVHVR